MTVSSVLTKNPITNKTNNIISEQANLLKLSKLLRICSIGANSTLRRILLRSKMLTLLTVSNLLRSKALLNLSKILRSKNCSRWARVCSGAKLCSPWANCSGVRSCSPWAFLLQSNLLTVSKVLAPEQIAQTPQPWFKLQKLFFIFKPILKFKTSSERKNYAT